MTDNFPRFRITIPCCDYWEIHLDGASREEAIQEALALFHDHGACAFDRIDWVLGDVTAADSMSTARAIQRRHSERAWRRRLPPDPDRLNNDRAIWAQKALLQFTVITGTDWQDAMSDLLVDLMHLADRDKAFCFERDLARARRMYADETAKGGDA